MDELPELTEECVDYIATCRFVPNWAFDLLHHQQPIEDDSSDTPPPVQDNEEGEEEEEKEGEVEQVELAGRQAASVTLFSPPIVEPVAPGAYTAQSTQDDLMGIEGLHQGPVPSAPGPSEVFEDQSGGLTPHQAEALLRSKSCGSCP